MENLAGASSGASHEWVTTVDLMMLLSVLPPLKERPWLHGIVGQSLDNTMAITYTSATSQLLLANLVERLYMRSGPSDRVYRPTRLKGPSAWL